MKYIYNFGLARYSNTNSDGLVSTKDRAMYGLNYFEYIDLILIKNNIIIRKLYIKNIHHKYKSILKYYKHETINHKI